MQRFSSLPPLRLPPPPPPHRVRPPQWVLLHHMGEFQHQQRSRWRLQARLRTCHPQGHPRSHNERRISRGNNVSPHIQPGAPPDHLRGVTTEEDDQQTTTMNAAISRKPSCTHKTKAQWSNELRKLLYGTGVAGRTGCIPSIIRGGGAGPADSLDSGTEQQNKREEGRERRRQRRGNSEI